MKEHTIVATKVRTQTAGNMWKVLVKPDDTVAQRQVLFITEVMKMEVAHEAPAASVVSAVHVAEGAEGLDADHVVVEII